jgi:aryl-alcohol dehydrogenase-like predicted oxidoreductase
MTLPNAAASGTFSLVDALPVVRLGYGAMRITGEGIWGPPADPQECLKVLRALPELGVNFIDTADSYGPYVSEELIAEALAPYPKNFVLATKGGLTRIGPNKWLPVGRPEYLRQCVLMSLRRLKVERIDLWQLHRIDAKVPRDEQFQVMAEMQKEGLINQLGLSEVNVEEIHAARRFFKVASVQNLYNLVNRQSEAVLDFCAGENIGFIPWFPLAAGSLSKAGSVLDAMAASYGVAPSALALAWILKRSPVMLPIPGTAKVAHLQDNIRGASVPLTDAEFKVLDELGKAEWKKTSAKA